LKKNKKVDNMINKKMNYLIITIVLVLFSTSLFAAGNDISSTYSIKGDLINQTPDPVRSGDIVELKFSVQNLGGAGVDDVTSNLVLSYPFIQIPGESLSQDVGKLYPVQTGDYAKIIKYRFMVDKDAPNGSYEITLNLTNTDTNISNVFKFNLSVVGKDYVQIITINKSNIDFGKVEKLDFLISNTGSSPLRNVTFSWTDPTDTILPVNSDNSRYIKFVDVNSSVTLSYDVMANTNSTPGLYKLNLNLSFEDQDFNKSTISTTAGLFVGGQTDFDVTFSESSSGSVSLSVANVGNNPASSVNVIIPDQNGYSVRGSNSSIVGNLDKGDYTIVSFPIVAKSRTSTSNTTGTGSTFTRNNKLAVTIEYTDSLGNRDSITKEINLLLSADANASGFSSSTRTGAQSAASSSKIYLYILIVVVVLGAGYAIYRARVNKRKKDRR